MFWNIALAVVLAVLAALISILGGYLAATETWHKWFFWTTGVLMVVLITLQAYRNEMAQSALQKQLNAIQQNTERPQAVPVVNVSPTPVNFPPQEAFVTLTGRSLVQFRIPEPIAVDFTTANVSPSVPALNEYGFDRVYIVETEPLGPNRELLVSRAAEEKYYKQFLKAISAIHPTDSRTIGPQQNFISTGFGPHLDKELEKEIQLGNRAIFHAIEFVWKDQAGEHVNEACEWLQPQSFTPGAPFIPGPSEVWHFCQGHNGLRQ
jgi:hypothetical protein